MTASEIKVYFYLKSNDKEKQERRRDHVTKFTLKTEVMNVSPEQVNSCRCSDYRSGSFRWMTVMVMSSRYLLASSAGRLSILARRFGATAP